MFSQASVILFTVGGGVYPSMHWDTPPLPSACWTPPGHTPLDTHLDPHTHSWTHTHPGHTAMDTPWTRPPPSNGHCSGRYASYWNAFLLHLQILTILMKIITLFSSGLWSIISSNEFLLFYLHQI